MPLPAGKPLRQVFGEVLLELAATDPRIVVLDGDVASSTGIEAFETEHPDHFLQMGIAEQNMLGVAAGLSTLGLIPVVSAFACFVVGRAFDTIRVLIAQPGLNVKIAGGYTGLLTGMAGKTHQIFNDVAILRSLAGITIIAPADGVEAAQAIRAMVTADGPFYMQITREPSPVLFDAGYGFQIGRAVSLRDGGDVSLVSTGVQTTRVFEAAEILARRGLQAAVLHVPTIKPIDERALIETARATGLVVVIEEQSVLGGLGSAVTEVLSERQPVVVQRLGIRDTYGESGPNDRLLDKYRLTASKVAEDVYALVTHRRAPRARWIAPRPELDEVG